MVICLWREVIHAYLRLQTLWWALRPWLQFPDGWNLFFFSFCLAVEREVVQKRTFTRWMNLHLEKVCSYLHETAAAENTKNSGNSNYGLCTHSLQSCSFTTWVEQDNFFLLLPLHPKTQGSSIVTTAHEAEITLPCSLYVFCTAAETRAVHEQQLQSLHLALWIIHVVVWNCLCAALKFH